MTEMDCRLNVKFDKMRDAEALDAVRSSMGGIVEIKEYDECIEVHSNQEWVRNEITIVRDHFREASGECPDCDGTGKQTSENGDYKYDCLSCSGRGMTC